MSTLITRLYFVTHIFCSTLVHVPMFCLPEIFIWALHKWWVNNIIAVSVSMSQPNLYAISMILLNVTRAETVKCVYYTRVSVYRVTYSYVPIMYSFFKYNIIIITRHLNKFKDFYEALFIFYFIHSHTTLTLVNVVCNTLFRIRTLRPVDGIWLKVRTYVP